MTLTQSTAIINQPAGSSVGIQRQQNLVSSTAPAFPALGQQLLLATSACSGRDNMDTLGNARELLADHL